MDSNSLRRLNWLWKTRHTHEADPVVEHLTVLTSEMRQQMDYMGKGIPGLVAAADAADEWKNVASYVCDGVNDSAMLQAAVDWATGNDGGHQVLVVGTFILTAELLLKANVALVGVGSNLDSGTGAYFERTGGPVIRAQYETIISNIAAYSETNGHPAIWSSYLGESIIDGCYLSAPESPVIQVDSGIRMRVTRCVIEERGTGTDPSIHLTDCTDSWIDSCHIYSGGILVDGESYDIRVTGNVLNAVEGEGIRVAGTANRVRIAHNVAKNTWQHGIVVGDSTTVVTEVWVHDNTVYQAGTSADDTFDGILIEGAAERVEVRGNRVAAQEGSAHMRWGINPSDTVVDCRIVGNDLTLVDTATFGSGPIRTASTGDVSLTLPADPTYGDNWT